MGPIHYVERRSPPFWVLPQVSHAYLYLHKEGDTGPPHVWGRMKLPETTRDPLQEHGGANASVVRHEHIMAEESTGKADKTADEAALHGNASLGNKLRPKWNKLRYDLSVVEPPEKAYFETGAAGRLLCSAAMTEEIDEDAEDEIE